MKRTYLIALLLAVSAFSYGQNRVESVLNEIEQNNPALKAASAEVDEEMLANRSEALLANPEVEFNYLLGAENIGNRHDVRVSQSFDIPTVTGMRARKTEYKNDLSRLKYESERLSIIQEARALCVDLAYYNSLLNELTTHLSASNSLVGSYEKRLKAGDATVLDLNKAKLHLASVQGELNMAEAGRQSSLSRLKALNGGKEIAFDATCEEIMESLPSDFETWFAEASEKNPVLEYVRKELELGRKQLAIDKASRLPDLTVGYMSEIRTAEKFRGVTLGVSIPLWSGANKVRQSRAGVVAAETRLNAAENDFFHQLQDRYRQASLMKANSEMMRSSLSGTDNREFLISALKKGEISMIDYLVEYDLYYEALKQTLEAERGYLHSLAALKVF